MKKFISMILAAVMLISCFGICVSADDGVIYGDANNDGKINVSDCATVLKYLAKWDLEESKFNFDAADVTHDDKVNLHDVSKLIKYLAKWTEDLPKTE